jgi:hypothetical protein
MSSAIQLPLPGDPFALFALKRAGFQMLRIRRIVDGARPGRESCPG